MTDNLNPQHPDAVPLMACRLGAYIPPFTSKRILYVGLVLIALLAVGLISMFGRRAWNSLERRLAGPAIVSTERIHDDGTYHNLIFLHHSTGENLILYGNVRKLFTQKGYQFWDHDYNQDGLTRPDGTRTHTHYAIPETVPGVDSGGNTDPDGLAVLFSQPIHNPPDNALSRLLQHPVVIFKSCFPNNALKSDEMLERDKALYLGMRNTMDQHPDHLFVLLTTPPLHPKETSAGEASRARLLSEWLQSAAFLGGHPNLRVFDFYNLLADPATNMLRTEYQMQGSKVDSHPNTKANEIIGPQFVEFVDGAVRSYVASPHSAGPQPNGN